MLCCVLISWLIASVSSKFLFSFAKANPQFPFHIPTLSSLELCFSFLVSSLGHTSPFSPAFLPFSLFFPLSYWEFSFLPFPSPVSSPSSPSSMLWSKASAKFCVEDDSSLMAIVCCATTLCFNHIFCHAPIVPLHVLALLPSPAFPLPPNCAWLKWLQQ